MPIIGCASRGAGTSSWSRWRALFALAVVEPVMSRALLPQAQSGRDPRDPRGRQPARRARDGPLLPHFNVGDAYDAGKVDQSIKSLFATGLFADVRIDREGAGVLVTVVENPVINQVAFEGNREVDKATLEAEVQLKPRSRVHARPRAGRRAAHPRRLPPAGPLCRHASSPRSSSSTATASTSCSRSTRAAPPRSRPSTSSATGPSPTASCATSSSTTQSGLFDFLKGTNIYDPDRLIARSRAAAPVLPQERLCRRAQSSRPGPSSIATARASSSPSWSTRASCSSSATIDIESALPGVDRRSACAASC